MNPRIALALLLVGVVALGAVVLAAGGDDDERAGGARERVRRRDQCRPGQRAPDFDLRDEQGERVSMRSLRGSPVVVTFLYTHCQDTCPITAQTVRGALDDLGHDVPALAISVDPPNDTPASARKFLAEQRANGRIRFVLGSRAQLRPIWKGYAIRPSGSPRSTSPTSRSWTRAASSASGYPSSEATPERLAHDLRLLEREASWFSYFLGRI